MVRIFLAVPKLIVGRGSIEQLGREAALFGKKILLVTGRHAARASGARDRTVSILAASGCSVTVFDKVQPEPPITAVDAARTLARECGTEVVIGLGGGSAMDVAKATAGLVHAPHSTAFYHDGGAWTHPTGLPFIGVPTTFGTASETTVAGVYTNPDTHEKKSIKHETMLARVAIVDADLGLTAPASVKAASGMDALTQAIEGFTSRFALPVSDALAFDAARLLESHLAEFVHDNDVVAGEQVAVASTMAGMAFTNAGLGIVHAVAHPVGARTQWPHGLVCGLLLHHALRFNRDAMPEKYARLCQLVDGDIADFCEAMLARVGITATLADAGLCEADLPGLVKETMPSGSLKANPRVCSPDDVAAFYRMTCWH